MVVLTVLTVVFAVIILLSLCYLHSMINAMQDVMDDAQRLYVDLLHGIHTVGEVGNRIEAVYDLEKAKTPKKQSAKREEKKEEKKETKKEEKNESSSESSK